MQLFSKPSPRAISLLAVFAVVSGLVSLSAAAAQADTVSPDPRTPTNTVNPAPDLNDVQLSSKPNAQKTIWLDFKGGMLTNTKWNDNLNPASNDGAPLVFNRMDPTLDSAAIRTGVFNRMAEIFAPFDINVTTIRPSAAALGKDSASDPNYGTTVLFTGDNLHDLALTGEADGLAYGGQFGSAYADNVWISTQFMAGNPQEIASIASHELGHSLGLTHDGVNIGTTHNEYYEPTTGLWSPIIGSALYTPFTRWSDNKYPNSSNPSQDDLMVMTDPTAAGTDSRQFFRQTGATYNGPACGTTDPNPPYATINFAATPNVDCSVSNPTPATILDDATYYNGRTAYSAKTVGGSIATATPLSLTGNPAVAAVGSTNGIIITNDDFDFYRITVPAGTLQLDALPALVGPQLDILMSVYNSAGTLIQTIDPPDSVVNSPGATVGADKKTTVLGADAHVSLPVAAGTYYVSLSGIGFGDVSTDTLLATPAAPKYGSLGHYSFAASIVAAPVVTPPAGSGTTPTPTATAPTPTNPATPAATTPAATTTTATPTPVLASTGTDFPWTLALLALLFSLLGVASVLRARRP